MIQKTCAIIVRKPYAPTAEVSAKLEAAIRTGCCRFLSGVEYGAGFSAAEEVLRQRAARPCLTLECVIPYDGHPLRCCPASALRGDMDRLAQDPLHHLYRGDGRTASHRTN